MKKVLLILLVLTLSLALVVGCGGNSSKPSDTSGQTQDKPQEKPKIIVGSKNFTEQLLVGYMIGALMEDAGYPVDYKLRLGGTGLVHESLVNGDINVYVEYTGTGLIAILQQEVMTDPDAVYAKVKEMYQSEFGLVWLEPWGFNNTYTITMRQDEAQELGVTKISDLKGIAENLVIGATQEFIPRSDGLAGLQEKYGFKFKNALGMDSGLMYQALQEKKVNAISGFATDGRIPSFGFINLEDDLNYFPPYYAAPVVRADLLEKDPEVANVLNKLAGKLDDTTMANLNYEVDGNKKDPEDVAKQFLKEKGLIN
ncbi:glycine betaine ABC transporter substrate-binding protein [Desulfitibacter alkalitolerans]|uniref:ABC transporter substrate-binding protein n=1 Tax=Desulfitibacter alkalitolerans TaxID=264641 RepID=UPI00047FE10F|nr:glycine betaine ABC transporter substrate-binding protein [Desulfitibacter alkalitolerans]